MRKCFYGVLVSYVWKPSTSSVQTDRICLFLHCFFFVYQAEVGRHFCCTKTILFVLAREAWLQSACLRREVCTCKVCVGNARPPISQSLRLQFHGEGMALYISQFGKRHVTLKERPCSYTFFLNGGQTEGRSPIVMLSTRKTHFFPSRRRFFFSLQQLQTIDDQ